jgi:hypothetical protein
MTYLDSRSGVRVSIPSGQVFRSHACALMGSCCVNTRGGLAVALPSASRPHPTSLDHFGGQAASSDPRVKEYASFVDSCGV